MADMLLAEEDHDDVSVYHLENPMRQSWEDVLGVIASSLGIDKRLPYDEWVAAMLAVPDDEIALNPAKKMAVFFAEDFERMSSGGVVMGTDRARRHSKTLRATGALDAGLVGAYVQKWKETQFL
jgi:hypothetical protein